MNLLQKLTRRLEMAFDADYLGLAGNPGGSRAPRIWTYKSEDTLATMDGAGYFNGATTLLKPGDKIHAVVVATLDADPETVSDAGTLVVLTNASGVVDTSDETALTLTDTD